MRKLELSIETSAVFISLPQEKTRDLFALHKWKKYIFYQGGKKKPNQEQILRFICQPGKHNGNVKEGDNRGGKSYLDKV